MGVTSFLQQCRSSVFWGITFGLVLYRHPMRAGVGRAGQATARHVLVHEWGPRHASCRCQPLQPDGVRARSRCWSCVAVGGVTPVQHRPQDTCWYYTIDGRPRAFGSPRAGGHTGPAAVTIACRRGRGCRFVYRDASLCEQHPACHPSSLGVSGRHALYDCCLTLVHCARTAVMNCVVSWSVMCTSPMCCYNAIA